MLRLLSLWLSTREVKYVHTTDRQRLLQMVVKQTEIKNFSLTRTVKSVRISSLDTIIKL